MLLKIPDGGICVFNHWGVDRRWLISCCKGYTTTGYWYLPLCQGAPWNRREWSDCTLGSQKEFVGSIPLYRHKSRTIPAISYLWVFASAIPCIRNVFSVLSATKTVLSRLSSWILPDKKWLLPSPCTLWNDGKYVIERQKIELQKVINLRVRWSIISFVIYILCDLEQRPI